MNKNALKTFAIWARVQLMEAVKLKAYEYGIDENGYGDERTTVLNGRALSNAEAEQRAELVAQIKRKGFNQVVEEVAYTWFNRFIALRYMEVNGYLPTRIRVFSNESGAFDPEILKQATSVELEGINKNIIYDFIDKQDNEGLFKYLVIAQCNTLNHNLPGMFEKINNYTELLFPNKLLLDGSVVAHLVNDIDEKDWLDIEIIGWLYQYYITEKHKSIIDIKTAKAIEKNDVPAATQLFTTDWVVEYIIDNSLGKYWIERNPNSPLKAKLKYYVQPSDFTSIDERVTPESITFYDPCMGSGHFLVYAFDVLMEIYLECGWNERDAAKSIIENNLYGIDLDERAYQLAYFAVMMKARSYSRRILNQKTNCNLSAIVETNDFNEDYLELFGLLKGVAKNLVDEFIDAKEYGSILNIKTPLAHLRSLKEKLNEIEIEVYDNFYDSIRQSGLITVFKPILKQALILAQKYTIVDTNPPYMNKYDTKLKKFILDNYADFKGDMFSVFMRRNFDSTVAEGYMGYMTPLVWMFIQSYEKLRGYIINNKHFVSLIQFEYSAFEEATVPICSFILKNKTSEEKGVFFRLSDFRGGMTVQEEKTLVAISNHSCGYYFESEQSNFKKIPGSPIAYWVSENILNAFQESSISDYAFPKQGLATGDNNRFLRFWREVSIQNILFNCESHEESAKSNKKWYPCNKGGAFRRWYGNNDYVVDWKNDGFEVKNFKGSVIRNPQFYFKNGITWSSLSSGGLSMRYSPQGFIFESKGSVCFLKDETNLYYLLGLVNSKIVDQMLLILSPTLDYHEGPMSRVPVILNNDVLPKVNTIVEQNVELAKNDWDSFETSWGFEVHPLIRQISKNPQMFERGNIDLAECFDCWKIECEERFNKLKTNEEELNRIFIDIYGLQDELTPEVEDKDVTVRKADLERDIKSLLSNAVGCIFGRYSINVPGLAYAGGEWDSDKYRDFIPDANNIVPISDDEYFEDDLTNKVIDFIKTVFGEESLESNLSFIASALGGKGTSREVLRKYFLNDFYKDHLKIYQKRPIYWQFDSGKKNGFKCLIYMHRYTPDLIAKIRTDYVFEQQERYRTQIGNLEVEIASASTSERVKLSKQLQKLKDQLHEITQYEEKVHHLADQMIDIDLDDGVKVNYAKFGDLLAKIK